MRGRAKAVGGECIAQPAGVHRRCVGEAKVLARGVSLCGRAKAFGGEWVVRTAGNASRSQWACVGAAWRSGSAWGGRVAVRGQAKEVLGAACR